MRLVTLLCAGIIGCGMASAAGPDPSLPPPKPKPKPAFAEPEIRVIWMDIENKREGDVIAVVKCTYLVSFNLRKTHGVTAEGNLLFVLVRGGAKAVTPVAVVLPAGARIEDNKCELANTFPLARGTKSLDKSGIIEVSL